MTIQPDAMHAITDETRDTVDDVLAYARSRALYQDVPLGKPVTPDELSP